MYFIKLRLWTWRPVLNLLCFEAGTVFSHHAKIEAVGPSVENRRTQEFHQLC